MTHGILDGLVVLSLTVLLLALFLKRVKQPYFIAYIVAGIILGPEVLGVIQKTTTIEQLGELGVILLLFFIGAEINLPDLSKNIKKPLLGTLTQVVLSFVFMVGIGHFMDWSWKVTILLSFVISLSSSAIIFQYLSKTGQIHSKLGLLTSGVLIMQDILIVPMMLVLSFMAKGELEVRELIKTVIGGLLVLLFIRAAVIKKLVKIPFKEDLSKDHDLQVFIGLLLCFGLAWITHWFGISAGLGAFLAGIWIGQDKATKWLDHALVPFRVFFLAFFFLSVGLQLDLDFLRTHLGTISLITLSVLVINSLINAFIFRGMGSTWRDSVYAGALLSQIGEFSFVLVNVATTLGLIGDYSFQITLAVITVSMMLTTIWISIIQTSIYKLPDKISLPQKTIF
ncbi:cation:proton antiporter [Roseivirga sp. UBA838]|uniref:cation:proton antiporter n=1 Tax=Roseivirga sp. UBA838 TaxID=1947393 RepID=UPI00257BF075|nr:cation:proton antiporter [Roseivirga sp. UBA838]|tara:strand:- start:10333 stop:11520 length:1188 start_codon:yes stop_codon:yes gene_type:complete